MECRLQSRWRGATAAAVALSMLCGAIAAQTPIPAPPAQHGTLIERVPCAGDPTQTFTLYLPPGYTRETRWPVLWGCQRSSSRR